MAKCARSYPSEAMLTIALANFHAIEIDKPQGGIGPITMNKPIVYFHVTRSKQNGESTNLTRVLQAYR
ncbi:hypothetical protein DMC47_27070 [Nostoc sp. 3335mG]|nr:hypothetical protein DMC47_27070 [Nostoc sp. 3335mG]